MVLLELFISFLKIGFTSFGGVSMVPLINSEMLSHGWMNAQEVSDIVAIAEMTPGPLGMNSSTFAGIRVAGIPGAIIAMLGILFPTLTIGFAAVVFFSKIPEKQHHEEDALWNSPGGHRTGLCDHVYAGTQQLYARWRI